jgi:PPOX class probable F420-dependent enzyme
MPARAAVRAPQPGGIVADLELVARLAAADNHLAVVAVSRHDGSVQASVVNAGICPHPVSGAVAVAFVTYGPVKLARLRADPRVTLTFRAGWEWATVEGVADIIGPDDVVQGFDPTDLAGLLREAFVAAGGTHDDWDEFDRVMAADRRAAVFVSPTRVYSNPGT